MTRLCLDTSAYSHFRRGDAPVVELIDGAREVFVPAIVLGELRAGFRLGGRQRENEKHLRAFLDHPAVAVLDVDDEAASLYAEIWVELRAAGTPVPSNDLWVAALAARSGATVLTYDEHFRTIRRVGSHILQA